MKRLGCSCLQSNTVTIEVSAVKVSNRILISRKSNIQLAVITYRSKASATISNTSPPGIACCISACSILRNREAGVFLGKSKLPSSSRYFQDILCVISICRPSPICFLLDKANRGTATSSSCKSFCYVCRYIQSKGTVKC